MLKLISPNCLCIDHSYNFCFIGKLNGKIERFNIQTGRFVNVFVGNHSAVITTIAISQDDKYIVTGSSDKTIRIWDVSMNKEIIRLNAHQNSVNTVKFWDNNKIISSSIDGYLKIWNFSKLLKEDSRNTTGITTVRRSGWINMVGINEKSKEVINSGDHDKQINFWNLETGKLLNKINTRHFSSIKTVSNDGNLLAFNSGDDGKEGKLLIYDTIERKITKEIAAISCEKIKKICINSNNTYLLAVEQRKIRAYSLNGLYSYTGNGFHFESVICCCDILIDIFVIGLVNAKCQLYSLKTHKLLREFIPDEKLHSKNPSSVELTPNKKFLFIGREDGIIEKWNALENTLLKRMNLHTERVTSLVWIDNFLISASYDSRLVIWNDNELEDSYYEKIMYLQESPITQIVAKKVGNFIIIVSGASNGFLTFLKHIIPRKVEKLKMKKFSRAGTFLDLNRM